MPVPAPHPGSGRMEAQELVSKNQGLEKVDQETVP
jgi:hypothetical protein